MSTFCSGCYNLVRIRAKVSLLTGICCSFTLSRSLLEVLALTSSSKMRLLFSKLHLSYLLLHLEAVLISSRPSQGLHVSVLCSR